MIEVRLTWKGTLGPAPVDGQRLRPDTLAALPAEELARVPLPVGRRSVALGELFVVERREDGGAGDPEEPVLRLVNPPLLDGLGTGMALGRLVVEGDAGDDLGASMAGGAIEVTGSAGARVGGPAEGRPRGMTGGEICIHGSVGPYAGLRQRRGLIVVRGAAGPYAGYRMLAGTLVLAGGGGGPAGVEMRRGTIIELAPDGKVNPGTAGETPAPLPASLTAPLGEAVHPGPHFTEAGAYDAASLVALQLVLRRIDPEGTWTPRGGRYRLWSGDRFELHKGELWQRVC